MSNSFTQPILYKSTNWFGSLSLFLSETGNFKWSQLLNGFIKYSFTLLFCIFFLPSSYHFYKKSNEQNKLYFKLGISLVILQVLFFVFLSLKYPPEIFKGIDTVSTWTYVSEVRYYNAIHVLLLIGGLVFAFRFNKNLSYLFFGIFMLININGFYKAKSILSLNQEINIGRNNFWLNTKIPADLIPNNAVLLEKALEQRASNYHYVSVLYAGQGQPILKNRNLKKIYSSKAITLLIIIDHVEFDSGDVYNQRLIEKYHAKLLGKILDSKVEIWGLEIKPGQSLNL